MTTKLTTAAWTFPSRRDSKLSAHATAPYTKITTEVNTYSSGNLTFGKFHLSKLSLLLTIPLMKAELKNIINEKTPRV